MLVKKQTNRSEKISSKVKTLVAEILLYRFSEDPIISTVSVVDAVSRGGFNFVKLFYYSSFDNKKLLQDSLDNITKFVRKELALKLNQKYTPEIKFVYDDTLEKSERIEKLLSQIKY